MRCEIKIDVLDETYIDTLIVSLVRQGYSVYYRKEDRCVCFTCDYDDTVAVIKEN